MGVDFCGGFVFIAVDVSPVGDYEKLIILAIIAGVRSQESYHVGSITLIPVGAGSPIIFAKNAQSKKPAPAIVLWAIDRT